MSVIVVLFLIGAALLAAEVVVPGGILGILAALAMLAGIVLAFVNHGSAGGWIAIGSALGLTVLTLSIEFLLLPKTALGRKLFLHAEVKGASQAPVADTASVVGKSAVADTALAPTGYVVVDGRRYEAYSRSGFVARGESLEVVGLDTFRLIVQKTKSL